MADPLASLTAALRDTVAWLEGEGLGCAVIGGVAVSLQGRPRATRDVDLVVIAGDRDWQAMVDAGAAFGIVPRIDDPVAFARESSVLLLRHEVSAIDIDISLGSLPFEQELVTRAVVIDADGTAIPVATPEDLIVMKAVAGRPRDLADIEGLLDAHPDLDAHTVLDQVRSFAEVLEMPEIASALERLIRNR